MSFETVCSGCGATSGPSVGVCPYCKTVMTAGNSAAPQETSVLKLYQSGRLDLALETAKKTYAAGDENRKNVSFLLLYAKILLDTEGPSSLINTVLSEALLLEPENKEIQEYLEIVQARGALKKGLNDSGEVQLKNVLRRSPRNVHANFILGTHLFWSDSQPQMAIPYLELCVRLNPSFLRAWGCLGAIYKKMGNAELSVNAFRKCVELETDPKMKECFQQEINSQVKKAL